MSIPLINIFLIIVLVAIIILGKVITKLQREIAEKSVDSLTGLMHRSTFENIVNRQIRSCKRSKKTFTILVTDINNLKKVNDKYGHSAGDEMIKEFAKLLESSIRSCDMVTRTYQSGDEFMIFLSDDNEETTVGVQQRLIQKIEEGKGYIPYFTGAAMGSATFSNEFQTLESLYKEADEGMYRNKRTV